MLYTLKIIHIFSLMAGAAAGTTNFILMTRLLKNPGPPPDMVRELMKTMGKVGPVAVILLWLTGLGMVWAEYHSLTISALFYLKLLGATIALVSILTMARTAMQAEAAGTPPPLPKMKKIAYVVWTGIIVAVVCAVLVFN